MNQQQASIDLPSIEEMYGARRQTRLFLIMRHHDDCTSVLLVKTAKDVHDFCTHFRIQVARRLIGQNYFRIAYYCTCDGHTLALSAGKLRRHVLHSVSQPDTFKNLFGTTCTLASGHLTEN